MIDIFKQLSIHVTKKSKCKYYFRAALLGLDEVDDAVSLPFSSVSNFFGSGPSFSADTTTRVRLRAVSNRNILLNE